MGQLLFAGGGAGRRALGMLGLGLFYTLFVGAFALAFHTAWPLVSFWLLMLNRMSSVLLYPAPNRDQRAFLGTTWSAHVVCYIAGVLLTLVLPLPSLGLTPQFVASMHLPGRGIWVTQPWRVIAFGAFYFAVIAWCEWTNYRTFTRRGDSPPPA
jgi:predicted Co/Zn/Cd cation transporter (cation efflux family)